MRILLHDYSGHAFPADLSRQLAAMGHSVLHASCGSFPAPKGLLAKRASDPDNLEYRVLEMAGGDFGKYDYWRRWRQERGYGKSVIELIQASAPDLLVMCNTPLDPLSAVSTHARKTGLPMIFWQQDVYSEAIKRYLDARFGLLGRLIGRYYEAKEAKVARQATRIVAISEHFRPVLERWSIAAGQVDVLPNWAVLDQLPAIEQDNHWAAAQGFTGKRLLLYAGSMGLKHEPDKLLSLAKAFIDEPDVLVVLVSSGEPAQALQEQAAEQGLNNLKVLPFQPVEDVPAMLASASLLLTVLEEGAGAFSVPSKVLGQLCAGRPMLASMPLENDASAMIREAEAGIVVAPDDEDGWIEAARGLLNDEDAARRHGAQARAYAEQRFDSQAIAQRFLGIVEKTLS